MLRAPRLTLAILVRDQEGSIGPAIGSAQAFVDEVVVRDAGSHDGTVEVARSMGATVVCGAWRDDFAEARNLLVAACRTDWILTLDGDERLSAGGDRVRRILRHPAALAYTVDVHSALSVGGVDHARPVRLFRRARGVRYRYRVHEVLDGLAGPREPSCLHVAHDGFAGPRRIEKAVRNLALLDMDLREHPHSPYLHWRRARELELLGVGDGARAALETAASLLGQLGVPALAHMGFACEVLADWMETLEPRAELSRALPLTSRVVLAAPDRPLARYLHARALVAAGRLQHAVQAARALLEPHAWRFELQREEQILTDHAPRLLASLGSVRPRARRRPPVRALASV